MKILILRASIILVLIVVFQLFMAKAINKTEEQNYSIILKEQNFEIRFYQSTTMATISSDAKTYKDLSGSGFRKLAGYIFGGNADGTQIAMTSPVHMNINDTMSTMSFVMPSSFNIGNLPKPNDSEVHLITSDDEYVAVVSFGGFASDQDLKNYSEKLKTILNKKGITSIGNPRYLGYNPPYQLVGRRNEIIISIDWEQIK